MSDHRRAGVPEDLIKLCLGHSQNLIDPYAARLRCDEGYRREWCERAGLGFELGELGYKSEAPIRPSLFEGANGPRMGGLPHVLFLSIGWVAFCINTGTKNSSAVLSPPLILFSLLSAATFLLLLGLIRRHNQATYKRRYSQRERSFLCQRCGSLMEQE